MSSTSSAPLSRDVISDWIYCESAPILTMQDERQQQQHSKLSGWTSFLAAPVSRVLGYPSHVTAPPPPPSTLSTSLAQAWTATASNISTFLPTGWSWDTQQQQAASSGKVVAKNKKQILNIPAEDWSGYYINKANAVLAEVWKDLFYGCVGIAVGIWAGNRWPFEKNFWTVYKLSRLPHGTAGHCYRQPAMPLSHRLVWWCVPSMGRFFLSDSNTARALQTRVDRVIHRRGFSVGYCFALRSPLWASYILTATGCRLCSEQREERPSFIHDRSIPRKYRVDGGLFRDSGYDRGHLAPKASVGFSRGASEDSFFLSNVMVQDSVLNRGLWKDLEKLARIWTERHCAKAGMAVCVGPVFEADTYGARFLHYNKEGKPDCTVKKVVNGATNKGRTGPSFFYQCSKSPSDFTPPQQSEDRGVAKSESVVRVPDFLFMALQDCATGKGVGFLVPNKTMQVHKDLLEGKAVGVSGKNADSVKYQSYIKTQMLSISQLEHSVRSLSGCGDGYKIGDTSSNFHLFQSLPSQHRLGNGSQLRNEVDYKHWAFPSETMSCGSGGKK